MLVLPYGGPRRFRAPACGARVTRNSVSRGGGVLKPIFEYNIADILPNNRYFIRLLLVHSLPALMETVL